MSAEIYEMNNFVDNDYTEERDDMYSALNRVGRRSVIIAGASVLTGTAAGLAWKGRKKVKRAIRKAEIRHLNRRKDDLAKELISIEAKLNRYSEKTESETK